MEWDDATRERLETALNESDVVGVRLGANRQHVDVLLHVHTLPAEGPLVADVRRILRLTSPTELRFLLRRDRPSDQLSDAPAIPLSGLSDVESLFESLAWSGALHGWRFFDEPGLTRDWPAEPSLKVGVSDAAAPHTFYWFNECGVTQDAGTASYCIEGTVAFEDLHVLDASEREIPMEVFVADGVRHWDALYAGDDRLSVEAQRKAQRSALTWRAWARSGVPSSDAS